MKLNFGFILTIVSFNCASEGLLSFEKTKVACEASLTKFRTKDFQKAIDILSVYKPEFSEEKLMLDFKTRNDLKNLGVIWGTDYVKTERIGSSYIRHIYLINYDSFSMRYNCSFYKPDKLWYFNRVNWDSDIESLYR